MSGMKYMEPNATTGPKCADGKSLTCSCTSSPCEGKNAALPSDLTCAGAGDDGDSSGCFKLHHTYGTPITAHVAVSGRGIKAQLTDACGAADVIKVFGSPEGLSLLVQWGAATDDLIDKSGKPKDAKACQALCAANADCKFFTYNDQGASDPNYGYFNGACILHKALSCSGAKYSTFHGAITGPAVCGAAATSTTKAAATTAAPADSVAADFAQTSHRLASLALGASLSAFLFA